MAKASSRFTMPQKIVISGSNPFQMTVRSTGKREVAERYLGRDGVHATAIPSLFFTRRSIYNPSFCIVVQGVKEVFLAQKRFRFGPTD